MLDEKKVTKVLNSIRPSLQMDGGDVELVKIREDNVIEVKLKGACGGCPMATMTLKMGIEKAMQKEIPEVKEVISV
ncbi:MAG: NifU family protein [Candidatus Marinimicrobia bacterium]|jgi:Fe-S cluster biogenesis protein NfuA|nr:NifU family protein [Candidatus Neomarinimicrobiota bacterium]